MKKTLALLLCFILLLLSCSACNQKPSESGTEESSTQTETQTETEKGTEKAEELPYKQVAITAKISDREYLRDPFVLLHDGTYYVYGTGWTVSTHTAPRLNSPISNTRRCVTNPPDYDGNDWAPEVYLHEGKFYMFTTYKSKKTGHRGCAIFVSDSPTGTFKLHSNGYLNADGTEAEDKSKRSDGHVTPADWDAIDGTFYIDKEGQPWMIFCHEWTSLPDGVGRMAAAKLSDDLTHFISEPIELFGARDAAWASNGVTDGCFMYETEDGKLLMIWSNMDGGYCVGIAISESGRVEGPWKQRYTRLYTSSQLGYDGGHGMIFTDAKGYLWMAIHAPNGKTNGKTEQLTYIPLVEKDGMLTWDRTKRELR